MAIRIETRKLKDLTPAPYNPRAISDIALAGLKASIKRFGIVEPVILNTRTGNVVGGHQRIKALLDLGETETDVVIVDLPESEEQALNITLNNPEIAGTFTDSLQDLLSGLQVEIGIDAMQELRLDNLVATNDNPMDEWKGMPEFKNEDIGAYRHIIVNFTCEENIQAFAKLIGQSLTDKARSIWFPQVPVDKNTDMRYAGSE